MSCLVAISACPSDKDEGAIDNSYAFSMRVPHTSTLPCWFCRPAGDEEGSVFVDGCQPERTLAEVCIRVGDPLPPLVDNFERCARDDCDVDDGDAGLRCDGVRTCSPAFMAAALPH